MRELTLITRGACANTSAMQANLNAALRALALPADYKVISLDTLPRSDTRTGYPTPTVLYRNQDLFGMPEPTAPFPAPA